MFTFLLSTAFAGVWLDENEMLSSCEADTEGCIVVLAEVTGGDCISTSTAQDGAVETRYEATLRILEVQVGNLDADEITLFTVNYDYSDAADSPSCYDTDPGHPAGEVARYYLSTNTMDNGSYRFYVAMAFYETADSNPGDLPVCADTDLPENNNNADTANGTTDGATEDEDSSKSGCANIAPPYGYAALSLLLFGLINRRKRTNG